MSTRDLVAALEAAVSVLKARLDDEPAACPVEDPTSHRLAYSPAEVADITGIGRSSVYELLSSRRLPSRKLDRRRLVLHADLMTFLGSVPPD
jgi:excisionase family DNA binding protein